jgi:hypothetical protein
MATAGCYRNVDTAMCDVLWKLRNVGHARRRRKSARRRSGWILESPIDDLHQRH